ncbi:Crp/Fnr family transcriptional regulator [Ancylothrix sp. C2]|uniref:Crp/Fnr family transcriptional regulator n=1 Tax=Ancylothrix sp. D3o TaxID=2953691 RepID=UPI0021BB54CA|nr:Crp/Fnr family transcriptional regulator [Ancylothrix sp. D3o]MCT7950717.1 Crp/Fnr family transcriptional regulator [Ancylothrix sp. D3o]
MYSSLHSEAPRPFLTWQLIVDWAQVHYRCRIFNKDERIPARPELLYLVQKGAVRLVGTSQIKAVAVNKSQSPLVPLVSDEAFLGFVGAGQPFEIVAQSPFSLQAYAHVDETSVIWMYWHDLENWPHFRREVLDAFRYQHQRQLLWLATLGQHRTIDRLLGLLTLLVEEYGEPCEWIQKGEVQRGYCLPWSLTHSQIASAIGSTRVTVTRLMGQLRSMNLIRSQGDNSKGDNSICLPAFAARRESK